MLKPGHVHTHNVHASGQTRGVPWITAWAPHPWPSMNGYAHLLPGHPWRGLSTDDIEELDPSLDVHGGLTFAEDNWIGFDTGHFMDRWPITDTTPVWYREMWEHPSPSGFWIDWTPDMVATETQNLATHVADIWAAHQ